MHHRSQSGMQEVIQMCGSFETTKSTKGASKLRRDLINSEIANLRDLLPLPSSTRQRLSQLQLMALVCVYVRKSNYFQQVFKRLHELGHPYSTPNIGFSKALSGFLIMMTQNGKLLYISDNAAEYLGHSMEDLLIHGDSVYDIIDKADHGTVQSELLRGGGGVSSSSAGQSQQNGPGEESRIFLCRMNVSRNARRQMRFGDQKVVLLQGRYLSYLPLCSRNEPVFIAVCTPVAMPETRECVVQGATNVFTTIHAMDMKFMHIDRNAEHYLGYTRSELGGISWYQLIHWNYMREAQSKHRLISQSEQEKSCILLLRLQTRGGNWIWVHCVLQVKDASDSSSSSNSNQQQQQSQQPSQSVIVATNQILNEREAAVMRANSWLYHYYTVQTKLQYGLAYPEAVAASQGSPVTAATAARLAAAAAYFPSPQLMNYTGHPHHPHHHPHLHPHHPHHAHHAQLTSVDGAGGYAAAAMAAAAASMPPPLHSPAHNGASGTASSGAYGAGTVSSTSAATAQSAYMLPHNPATTTHHHPHSHHPHHFEMSSPPGKDTPLDFSLAASSLPFEYQMSAASPYGAAAAYWSHHHHHHHNSSSSSHGYSSSTAPPTGSGGTVGSQRSTGSEGSPSNSSTVSASATSPQTWSLQLSNSSTPASSSSVMHQQSSPSSGKASTGNASHSGANSTTPRKRAKKEIISPSTPIVESISSPPTKPSERSSRSSSSLGGASGLSSVGPSLAERGGNSSADCSVATLSTPFPYHNRYRNAYKMFSSPATASDEEQAQTKEEHLTMSCPLTPSPVWEGQTHRVPDLQFYNSERDLNGVGGSHHHSSGVLTTTDLIHCVPTYQPYLSYCAPPPGTMAHHHPAYGTTSSLVHVNHSTGFGMGMGLTAQTPHHPHSVSESGSPNKENRLPPTPESDHGDTDESRPVKWESL